MAPPLMRLPRMGPWTPLLHYPVSLLNFPKLIACTRCCNMAAPSPPPPLRWETLLAPILWGTASAVVMVGHVVAVVLHVVHWDFSVVAPTKVDTVAV